jgi:hypothetical protein
MHRCIYFLFPCREFALAEMGVAVREDGITVGLFSPKKVCGQGLNKTSD